MASWTREGWWGPIRKADTFQKAGNEEKEWSQNPKFSMDEVWGAVDFLPFRVFSVSSERKKQKSLKVLGTVHFGEPEVQSIWGCWIRT